VARAEAERRRGFDPDGTLSFNDELLGMSQFELKTANHPESRVDRASSRDAALKAESRQARMSGSSCRESKAI
jgi:hypothetical protein